MNNEILKRIQSAQHTANRIHPSNLLKLAPERMIQLGDILFISGIYLDDPFVEVQVNPNEGTTLAMECLSDSVLNQLLFNLKRYLS